MSNFSDDDDDEPIALSGGALAALQEFLKEKEAAEERFQALKQAAEEKAAAVAAANAAHEADAARLLALKAVAIPADLAKTIDISDFKEDWQLSQFWYNTATRDAFSNEAIAHTSDGGRIGCVSSPSAFVTLKRMDPANRDLFVFEFDKRFDIYGREFVFYDFNHPTSLDEFAGSRPLKGTFDFLIVDPPFLSDECWTKTAQTVKWLIKPDTGKILVNTGQVMGPRVCSMLGCTLTSFLPMHQNGLSNEFRTYVNYKSMAFPALSSTKK
ncbi:putative N6-adenine methyltransferase-domain-containing protein [Entophlyctis helioformis]|nr:putative N6-adenine methyltransferase-domain-containing protein [Entophlyctis helioformis]